MTPASCGPRTSPAGTARQSPIPSTLTRFFLSYWAR